MNLGMTVEGEGFGTYSIAGYDTYAFVFTDYLKDPTSPIKGIMLISRIDNQRMTMVFVADPQSFSQQMPTVQKMIDSINITGSRGN